MTSILAFFEGKKTYIVAIVTGVLGILMSQGIIPEVPEWAWAILGALGLGAVRAAVGK